MADQPQPEQFPQDPLSPFAPPTSNEEPKVESISREQLSAGGMFAWVVIAIVMLAMISMTAFSRSAEESRTEATASDLFPVQLQGRTLVGQKSFLQGSTRSKTDDDDDDDDEKDEKKSPSTPVPDALNDGTYEQRLCYVLLINENNGADDAAEKLEELDKAAKEAEFELSEDQQRLRKIVQVLVDSQQQGDYDAKPLSAEDREFLEEKLGWIGQLGLVPEGTSNTEKRKELLSEASWSMGMMMVFMLFILLTLMAGVGLAIMFSILFAVGKLTPKFLTHGKSINIYIETFALWMVFFFVGPLATVSVLGLAGVELTSTLSMVISIGFFFGSLIVLVYPVMRGIPFKQLCSDIGWKAEGGIVDLLISPVNYIAGTPLMMIGLFCVLFLTFIATMLTEPKPFGTSIAAGHPIQDDLATGEWTSILYVVLMACIAAPIVEETMFRGVLYRHLRELSGAWKKWLSIGFSAVFNGLIFAAIHPQGFVAIPLLTALAINFSLAREWRDSLIAPIIMHAINNGAVTFLLLTMMS